ncbi:MAG: protein translocase subunit SecF, partial [Deinococcus sp.]|nr:protein translocase subunit SecF [Deinococcus sp.]
GALAGLGATLTLPGIAGLVLTIGMAVDGNVISFERVREEIRNGKTLKAALRAGIDRSLATILDANITTLFAALALYQFTTGPVRGFAVTLSLGIVVAVFSNLIVAPLLLHALIGVGRLTRSVIGQPKIAFIAAAPVVGGTTGILATLGLAFVLYLSLTGGLNLGIDFTGGTSILLLAPDNVRVEDVRGALASAGVGGAVVQRLVDPTKPQNLISVRAKELTSQDTLNAALRALQALGTPPVQSTGETTDQPASSVTILQTDSVGPAVGADLRRETSLAILVALVLILIYVGWRFEPIFGIAAVIALVHDVSITAGFLAVTGREFTIPIVAALLTIIGYSLNDSIIVADRIREMTKLHRKQAYPEVVDMAINMTLSRTVMTTFTTLLPVTSLLILGGPVLRDFSIAMVTGLLVGTFSSVYIMSPVVVWWKLRNPKVRRLSQQAARA